MATILHQLKTDGYPLDGMSYVFQCDNSDILVVDGGMQNDVETLYSYLQTITGQDVPRVTAWILTHNHADHTYAFLGMAQKHAGDLKVESVIYDFPGEDFFQIVQPVTIPELKMVEEAIDTFGARRIVPQSGTTLTFGSLKLNVLYTWRDLPPLGSQDKNPTTTDTSLVFRLEEAGQTVLFLGDVQAAGNRVMIDRYGDALKSDVVQVAHHGELSTTEEFYRIADPQILLWPQSSLHAQVLSVSKINRYLFSQSNVKEIYLAGDGTLALPLPIGVTENPRAPFTPAVRPKDWPQEPVKPSDKELDVANCPEDFFAADAPRTLDVLFNHRSEQKATLQMLHHGDSLYLQVTLYNSAFADNPDQTGTGLCDAARIYFAPTLVEDLYLNWEDTAHLGNFKNLHLFPHPKKVQEGLAYNTRPDFCQSHAYHFPGGCRLVAKFPLPQETLQGNPFCLGLAVSLMDPDTGRRSSWLSFPGAYQAYKGYLSPGCLPAFYLK